MTEMSETNIKIFPYNNIEFSYANESAKEYIKSLQLKSFDGRNLIFYPDLCPDICNDASSDVYFIKVRIEKCESNHKREKELIEKYKKIYYYTRRVDEYILLIKDNPIYIFADISCHADGESVKLLEITSNVYTSEDIKWIRAILCKAFRYVHGNCPEYFYSDNYAVFSFKK